MLTQDRSEGGPYFYLYSKCVDLILAISIETAT